MTGSGANGLERLADRLAVAILKHGPCAGSRLAVVVEARKSAVLAELRSNPMFESQGRGRGSRWRLAGNGVAPQWEPLGTDLRVESRSEDGADLAERLRVLERRVAELERSVEDAFADWLALGGEDR